MKSTYGKRPDHTAPERHRRILLYGDSLILESIGAALGKHARFEVLPLSAPLPGFTELEALSPDVILFDVEATRPDAAFSLLETRSGLLLLGISPDGNVVRVWAGLQLRELSVKGLKDFIERHVAPARSS